MTLNESEIYSRVKYEILNKSLYLILTLKNLPIFYLSPKYCCELQLQLLLHFMCYRYKHMYVRMYEYLKSYFYI